MTNPAAVAFDLDGTLVDTLEDLAHATEEALRLSGYGRPDGQPRHPLEAYRRFVGNGARRLIERAAGETVGAAQVDALLETFVRVYDRDCLLYTKPYPGIPELIEALECSGYRMVVVTNKPEEQAVKILRHFFPRNPFACVCGGRAGRRHKPDPAALLETLAAAGADPGRTLYVGDSDVDVMTAHNAGLPCAGAVWGFRGAAELAAAGADVLLFQPADLFAALKQRNL